MKWIVATGQSVVMGSRVVVWRGRAMAAVVIDVAVDTVLVGGIRMGCEF